MHSCRQFTRLQDGDGLIFFTDGVYEAMNKGVAASANDERMTTSPAAFATGFDLAPLKFQKATCRSFNHH